VLQRVTDAVLVIDRDRNLRFVNHRARQLLGYEPGETLAGRCRHLTRGLDCEATCPVTFALQQGLEVVDDFESLYQNRDGDPVPVRVTAVPLLGPDGALLGHLEILRPSEPAPGFILAGRGPRAIELRRRVGDVARSGRHLVLVGERLACLSVALTVHRLGGLATQLFCHWQHTGLAELPTPPGTLFVDGEGWAGLCASAPPGLRVVAAVARQPRLETALPVEVIELPAPGERREDLPLIIAAWVEELAPGVRVAPGALQRLCGLAAERGMEKLQEVLAVAVGTARDWVNEEHLPARPDASELLEQLLEERDPLAALEDRLLREVLERCGWRMQEAADRLGISRVTLWRKLREHGIEK
jgi:PAS domain S-box-containing protein